MRSPRIADRGLGIETAKLHGVDPRAYLRAAVLAADRGIALLPWDMPQGPSPPSVTATESNAIEPDTSPPDS